MARLIYRSERATKITFVIVGVLTLVSYLINWGSEVQLDKGEWAGWAQAVGSVIAIGVAFYTGSRQSRDAIRAIEHSINLTERRKHAAFGVIAESARKYAEDCMLVFHESGFSLLAYVVLKNQSDLKSLIQAVEAIPVHDVGSYGAVSALVGMKRAMYDLGGAIASVEAYLNEPPRNSHSAWHDFDTTLIRLCCDVIEIKAHLLILAMALAPQLESEA